MATTTEVLNAPATTVTGNQPTIVDKIHICISAVAGVLQAVALFWAASKGLYDYVHGHEQVIQDVVVAGVSGLGTWQAFLVSIKAGNFKAIFGK